MHIIEIQCATEGKCWQIRRPDLPYSMPVCYLVMFRQLHNNLKRCHEGKVQTVVNMLNRANAHQIPNPPSLPLQ
jgi:hypothetical protein